MKLDQCERAVELGRAIVRLEKLRKLVVEGDGKWRLELQATDGDDDGGTIRCGTILPADLAAPSIDPLLAHMRAELKSLGVE
jgi:hypothetical protein